MDMVNGQELISVFWHDGAVEIGKNGCVKLIVCMESGQMAGVPWALATYEGGKEYEYNLAMAEGVRRK